MTWSGAVAGDPTAVAVGEGAVWVAGGEDGTVVQVDPDGPRVVESRKTGSSPAAIAVAGGSVWAAADAPRSAHRGGTLRVLVPSSPKPRQPLDWLDPYAPVGWAAFSLESLAYDGLVAYRRVEASGGRDDRRGLGHDRAAGEPRRPQLRLHAASRTALFRRQAGPPGRLQGLDRALPAGHARPADQQLPQLYEGIVGAPRCIAANDRCDLSRGIETDARTRTITIHLTRPDPEFLHKLTVPFAFVVPADSPARATAGRTPPGTGPYRVAAWDSRRGGTFERNPHFRSGTGPARARGLRRPHRGRPRRLQEDRTADRRDRSAVPPTSRSSRIRSAATSARLACERSRRRRRDGSAARRRGAPNGSTSTCGAAPSTTAARGARSTSRSTGHRVVALGGGREVGLPSCQILPAGVPGPRAPLPLHREAGGGSRLVCA